MKSPRRWLFNGLAALSVLLLVATLGLWIRSYYRADAIVLNRPTYSTSVSSECGIFCASYTPAYFGTNEYHWPIVLFRRCDPVNPKALFEIMGDSTYHRFQRLGFVYDGRNRLIVHGHQFHYTGYQIYFAHWFTAVLCAVYPAIFSWQRYRCHRRTMLGLCLSCGYDLRATPDRCPECGTTPPKRKLFQTEPSP